MAESVEDNRELLRLWRVYRTAREMCFDRGYEIAEDELNISYEDFRTNFADEFGHPNRQKLNFSARPSQAMQDRYTDPPTPRDPHPTPQIGTIWVEFNGEGTTVGVNTLRRFAHHITTYHFATGVLITAMPITPAALKIVPSVLPAVIETFQEQDLLVNITRHELVPKHILLSKGEKIALLERYRVKESQLPRIQVNDPVAKYLGLRRGQVVKIIRRSETAGRYASYRWCI